MKRIDHNLHAEKSGFVVDYLNCVLGASPDGKVIDLHEHPIYGIVEVKCPEEYKDVSPREICFVSKNPCIKIDENIVLRTDHYYCDQLQYQLGVSCQSWCDFVLFTNSPVQSQSLDASSGRNFGILLPILLTPCHGRLVVLP